MKISIANINQIFNKHKKVIVCILFMFLAVIIVFISYYLGKTNTETIDQNGFFYKNGFRYKKILPPRDYIEFTDLRWCYTDNVSYTDRYYLFELYEFQKMSANDRIERFVDHSGMDEYEFQSHIGKFMEIGKIYEIADNYCITMNESMYTIRTDCYKGAESVQNLPSERGIAFGQHDDKGIYWVSYKDELWKDFNKLGKDGVYKEIEREKESIAEKCRQYRPLDY